MLVLRGQHQSGASCVHLLVDVGRWIAREELSHHFDITVRSGKLQTALQTRSENMHKWQTGNLREHSADFLVALMQRHAVTRQARSARQLGIRTKSQQQLQHMITQSHAHTHLADGHVAIFASQKKRSWFIADFRVGIHTSKKQRLHSGEIA